MANENVVQMPTKRERLAIKIKDDLVKQAHGREAWTNGRAAWIDATYNLCLDLVEARKEIPGDTEFGRWCRENGLGEDVLNKNDRNAAIEMGKNPEGLREVLSATNRTSIRHIFAHEWKFPSDDDREPEPEPKDEEQEPEPRDDKPKPKAEKPKPNPRPKPKPGRDDVSDDKRKVMAQEVLDNGRGIVEVADEYHVSKHIVQIAVAREEGYREGLRDGTTANPANFSKSMRRDYDRAVSQIIKQLRVQIEAETRAEIRKRWDEYVLPHWGKLVKEAEDVMNRYKGLMERKEFNTVLWALHPDNNNPEKQNEAFRIIKGLEHVLVKKEVKFSGPPLPKTMAEWDALRRK